MTRLESIRVFREKYKSQKKSWKKYRKSIEEIYFILKIFIIKSNENIYHKGNQQTAMKA